MPVLSLLASPLEKVTAGLAGNEGFISSVEGMEGNISGYGCRSVQISEAMGNLFIQTYQKPSALHGASNSCCHNKCLALVS